MQVKDCPFKKGDKIKEFGWRITYLVLSVEPFNGCAVCEGCDGSTVCMTIQRVLKDGTLKGDADFIFGERIFDFQKATEIIQKAD